MEIIIKKLKASNRKVLEIYKKRKAKSSMTNSIHKKLKVKGFQWTNELLLLLMNEKQKVQYAIYAAEIALPIFERYYPKNNEPREVLDAAKRLLKNPRKERKNTTDVPTYIAEATMYYSFNTITAAYATYAAHAAACATDPIIIDANAICAVAYTICAVNADVINTKTGVKAIETKIINYGLSLITEK